MKTTKILLLAGTLSLYGLLSCQRNVKEQSFIENTATKDAASSSGASSATASSENCNHYAYTVTLESRTLLANNNWEWVWSVQNPNPGNGNNGTVQNLSHWGMEMGACFIPESLVAAAYSFNGTTWTSFTPSIHVDPSQGCMTKPVIKFDAGTNGSAKTYYRLVVNQFYSFGTASGYYKSGVRTGCCTFPFFGMGCGGNEEERVE